MRISFAAYLILLACASIPAHAAVNLQTCTVTPTGGGLIGCPTASVSFAPVSPNTLVRSQVNGVQGWRPFSALKPADSVVSTDGQWHVLSSLSVSTGPITTPSPPIVVPPPPSVTQDVLITLVGGTAPQSVIFSGVSVPACFAIGPPPAKQVCLP